MEEYLSYIPLNKCQLPKWEERQVNMSPKNKSLHRQIPHGCEEQGDVQM